MNALGVPSHSLMAELEDKVQKALIINIYLHNGELIKVGDGSPDRLKISSIVDITNDFLTIKYDSHETNILYTAIAKIEYFYCEGV
jgi:hypothetical protein